MQTPATHTHALYLTMHSTHFSKSPLHANSCNTHTVYLTTHSTHFSKSPYSTTVPLHANSCNTHTVYLRLYGVRHMVMDHSDSEKGNLLPPYRLLFPINSKGSFNAPSHRQDSTYHNLCYTSRGALPVSIHTEHT